MPEEKSVGKALKKALGLETIKIEVEPRIGGTSQLMNPRRLMIFEYLWSNPCSHIRQISRATRIPVESLKWHLKSLEKSKLLASKRFERKIAYFPRGLIRYEDVELFAQISDTKRREILRTVWETPEGAELNDISSKLSISKQAVHHHLSILEDLSVIAGSKGRKPAKYELHKNTDRLVRLYKRRIDKVLTWLLQTLEKDCLNPKIRHRREEKVKIRISLGMKKKTLEFYLNPFSYII